MVEVDSWGRDHWGMLAYIAERCRNHGGRPLRSHVRCSVRRHPTLAHSPGPCPPTRLRGGIELPDHDGWDCAKDLESAGMILMGTDPDSTPRFALTGVGSRVAEFLLDHERLGTKVDFYMDRGGRLPSSTTPLYPPWSPS